MFKANSFTLNTAVESGAVTECDLFVQPWQSAAPEAVEDPFQETCHLEGLLARKIFSQSFHNPFYYNFSRQVVSFDLPAGNPAEASRLRLFLGSDQTLIPFQLVGNGLFFFMSLAQQSKEMK